jgi:hypothetical protein
MFFHPQKHSRLLNQRCPLLQGVPALPERTNVNKRERAVVEWLRSRLGNRLADREGGVHEAPWQPRDNVIIGVLPPRRVKPAPATPASDRDGESEGNTEPEVQPSPPQVGEAASLGLDFKVHPRQGVTAVTLSIDVSLALYLEEIAPLEGQFKYHGEAYFASHNQESDISKPTAAKRESLQENDATALATAMKTEADVSAEAPGNPAAAGDGTALVAESDGKKAKAPTTRLMSQWRRENVTLKDLRLTLSLSGEVEALSGPLNQQINAVIKTHYSRPEAMRPLRDGVRTNTMPVEALKSRAALDAEIHRLLADGFDPERLELELAAFAQDLGNGEYLVRVTLSNVTILAQRTSSQDLSAYDCQIAVHPDPAAPIVPQRFELAPDDYRLEPIATVPGHGTACVAVAIEDGGVRSETLPIYEQMVVRPRTHEGIPALRWEDLASNPLPILSAIEVSMGDYLRDFQTKLRAATSEPHEGELRRGCDQFADELRRFRLGRLVLGMDTRLENAFKLANEAFADANRGKPFDTWRLFQLVYIVSHLPDLAARETQDPEVRAELDYADVLWFPAGGGKTEAYLGLIVTGLFYDRLRGKHGGVSAWMRFPLRMLSVQQLTRMLRVLVVAEELRLDHSIGSADDDPFALGYLVGGPGTPNALEQRNESWWKGWDIEVRNAKNGEFQEIHENDRLVTRCPYCNAKSIVLDLDLDAIRILHRCTTPGCGRVLPLYISDEEVFRYLPAVVVSTVDKLTGYTWFGEYTTFTHGPRFRCPKHGYYVFPRRGTCLVAPEKCPPPRGGHPRARPIKDPVPALTIQDEMHLLKEELGAFSGHYEGLIAELQRGGPSRLPTKILAASATIEQYEDQLRQVYGRRPRAFPSQGFTLGETFYVETTENVRRVFLGVLPNYRRKADVAAVVQAELVRAITELQDDPDRLTRLSIPDSDWDRLPTAADVNELVFDYEVSLGYVNSKAHGAKLDEELAILSSDLSAEGRGALSMRVLTGQVPIPDLADAIEHVEVDTLATPREERLRALIGTSVVSHGVDLDRLNNLVMAGMPTTAADYIQVTARSGRTHVGLVVTVYDGGAARERSLFSNFMSFHAFLDQMVTPVPVNKYAYFVADRTLPGIMLALFHDMARRGAHDAPPQGVRRSKDFQKWWNAHRPQIDAEIAERLPRCYNVGISGVNDPGMEKELVERAVTRWEQTERNTITAPAQEPNTAYLFRHKPLSNFRTIDDAAGFTTVMGSRDAYDALVGLTDVRGEG